MEAWKHMIWLKYENAWHFLLSVPTEQFISKKVNKSCEGLATWLFKRYPNKMVKHTQTIQISDTGCCLSSLSKIEITWLGTKALKDKIRLWYCLSNWVGVW